MSDYQSIINKIEHPAKGQDKTPPPSAPRPNNKMGYILGLLLSLGIAGGVGFFGGQALGGNDAEATLDAITAVVQSQETATSHLNQTATANVLAYTATPSPTSTVTATATSSIPIAEILPLSVNVYEYTTLGNQIKTTLFQGASVQITGVSEDGLWYEISYKNAEGSGETGYVPVQALHLREGGLTDLAMLATVTDTPVPTATPGPPTRTPFPTYTATPEIPIAQVRPAVIEVHSGAGQNYPVIDSLQQTNEVTLIGVSDDGLWYEITYSQDGESQTGFVQGSQLTYIAGALDNIPPAISPSLTPIPNTANTIPQVQPIQQILVIREGPHVNFPAVGAINANNRLNVLGLTEDGTWVQVEFPTSLLGMGWVPLDSVLLLGNTANLPVLEAPEPPTEPPVRVIIDGGNVSSTGSVPNTSNPSNNPPTAADVASLPRNASNELPDLSIYDTYAFEMRLVLNGADDDYDYADNILQLIVAGDNQTGQTLMGLYASGVWINDSGEDFSEILPIIGGVVDNQPYLYFREDQFCYPDDDDFTSEIFIDFPILYDRTGEFVVNELMLEGAVFGVIEDDRLQGIPANHYQFLGFENGSDYRPTSDVQVDLWYSPNEESLISFAMFFDYRTGSATREAIVGIILGQDFIDAHYTGTIELYFQPLVIDGDVANYLTAPSECDYLFD